MATHQGYTPTEAKYKGGAETMYVTYDLPQKTRGRSPARYPKAKRVYVPGELTDWRVGTFTKKSGRKARGVKLEYEQERSPYQRKSPQAERAPVRVPKSRVHFTRVVEVPKKAQNVGFHRGPLPHRYARALQEVK